MPTSNSSLNSNLYDLLVSQGYTVTSIDSSGKSVPVPEEADIFQFHFHKDDVDYGTVTVSVDGKNQLIVYANDKVANSPSSDENKEDSWVQFLKKLKKFATRRQLSFKVTNMNKLENDMKVREYNKRLDESYWGNRNTSWNDSCPKTIKIMIKHSKPIEEGDARYRHISKIFLETDQGERILVPSTKPGIARVFARHIAEGGEYNDQRWSHIKQLSEEVNTLGQFIRATASQQFNESVDAVITEAKEVYKKLRENLRSMRGSRGYNNYFENWVTQPVEENDTQYLSEIFTQSKIDPRIQQALPLLAKINVFRPEMNETQEFESWANDIISTVTEDLIPQTPVQQEKLINLLNTNDKVLAVGPDGINAIAALEDIIENSELNERLKNASYQDSDRDARPIIIGWMEEQPGKEFANILAVINSKEQNSKKNNEKQKMKEADNPNYFGAGYGTSPIPGTPESLQPHPSPRKLRHERSEEDELLKWMGHFNK